MRIDSRSPGRSQTSGVAALGLALAVMAGTASALDRTVQRSFLIVVLAVLVVSPVALRVIQRRFDVFEPIHLFVLGGFVLFVLRPVFELTYDSHYAFGNAYSDLAGFDGALVIALVGTAGLYAGYALRLGSRLGARLPAVPAVWSPATVGAFAYGLVVFGTCLYGLYIVQTGQGLSEALAFFQGRETDVRVLGYSSAYLYFGPYLLIPAASLLLLCWQRDGRGRWLVSSLLMTALALLITVPRGDRTWLLCLLLPLFAVPYLRKGRRPRLLSVLLLLALVIPILNVMLDTRYLSSRGDVVDTTIGALSRPDLSMKYFMLNPNTSMFTVVALTREVVPTRLGHKPGRVITASLAAAVPGKLWPNKPLQGDELVYRALFPRQAAVTRAGNTGGMFGGFYFDSGLIGVALYAMGVGVGFRALWAWWRIHGATSAGARILFAAALPLAIVLQRGSISDTLARSSFLVLPIVVVFWLASRPLRAARPPRRVAVDAVAHIVRR